MKIFGKNITFRNPKKVDIVIFDECNSEYVKKVLNANLSVGIFKMRPYEIFITPTVIINVLFCIDHFSLKFAIEHPSGFVFGALFQLRAIYFEACLFTMRPKAVITIIDNSSTFHWLSKYSRKFPYIAIQNGTRLRYAIAEDKQFHLQHYFCWGTQEEEIFDDFGYEVERYYPVGSLLASLYFKNQFDNSISMKYDLLIVSTWRGNIDFTPDVVDTMRSMNKMDKILSKYIVDRSIKAAIILRSERNSDDWIMQGIGSEYDYYRSIYGDTVDIIEANFTERTIYPIMQQSRLIVSCLSSALNEAYGLGKKIIFFNYTGGDKYHCDIDFKCTIKEENYLKVRKIIDDLLNQSESVYHNLHFENIKRVMAYPVCVPTYKVIESQIDEIISQYKF